MVHTGDIRTKLREAQQSLFLAQKYMAGLGAEIESLQKQKLPDKQAIEYIHTLIPIEENAGSQQKKNLEKQREDLKSRYFEAPDLQRVGKNAYRFINAVSDYATHAEPLRKTANYRENLFLRTMDGHALIDKAYQMVRAA